jgi:hypothetical protein
MKNEKIILTLESNGIKSIHELSWDATVDELVNAFYAAMVGITFSPNLVINAMKQFVKEQDETFDNEYIIPDVKRGIDYDDEEEFITAPTSAHVDPFILSIVKKLKSE